MTTRRVAVDRNTPTHVTALPLDNRKATVAMQRNRRVVVFDEAEAQQCRSGGEKGKCAVKRGDDDRFTVIRHDDVRGLERKSVV